MISFAALLFFFFLVPPLFHPLHPSSLSIFFHLLLCREGGWASWEAKKEQQKVPGAMSLQPPQRSSFRTM